MKLKTAIISLLLSASWSILQAQTLIFTPQWTAQAQFAGYYVAQDKGFYREAGIDVKIVHPAVSESPVNRVRNQQCQATTLQMVQALEIIDQGTPLVNILQTSMENGEIIVWHPGKNPLKKKGLRVGIWNAMAGQLPRCMNQKENLGFNWVPFASNVNLFVAGALDATLAQSYNEYYQILQCGVTLNEENVYRFSEHGYNIQQEGLYMTRDYYMKHRDQARRFAKASKKGWLWAVEHPEETLEIVMKYVKENRIATNRTMQEFMLKEILRLQIDRDSKKREFRLRPDMVKKASEMLHEFGILKREVKYEEMIVR